MTLRQQQKKIVLRYAIRMYIVTLTDGCDSQQLRKVTIGLHAERPVSAPAVALTVSHWQGIVSALGMAEWPEPEIRWLFGKRAGDI